jgi:hypothetical protein
MALHNVAPTDSSGNKIPDRINLGALNFYRGIPRYNDFCLTCVLKPFKTWEALTGERKGKPPTLLI